MRVPKNGGPSIVKEDLQSAGPFPLGPQVQVAEFIPPAEQSVPSLHAALQVILAAEGVNGKKKLKTMKNRALVFIRSSSRKLNPPYLFYAILAAPQNWLPARDGE
jgi:hypothetical protein